MQFTKESTDKPSSTGHPKMVNTGAATPPIANYPGTSNANYEQALSSAQSNSIMAGKPLLAGVLEKVQNILNNSPSKARRKSKPKTRLIGEISPVLKRVMLALQELDEQKPSYVFTDKIFADDVIITDSTNTKNLYEQFMHSAFRQMHSSIVDINLKEEFVLAEDFIDWINAIKEKVFYTVSWGTQHLQVAIYAETWMLSAIVDKEHAIWSAKYTGGNPFFNLQQTLRQNQSGTYVKWFFRNPRDGAILNHTLELEGNDPYPEFYPEVENLSQFYTDFAESSANVLLLIGPPGTGKTTFLRGLLREMNINAWITYDPIVQQDEQFTIMFADPAETDGRVLVLEDCDELMSNRTDGNKLMSRILNLSDGLVQLPKRKLIFSTNLPSLDSVDPALLRPGRCFAAVKFRPLNSTEATAAASVIGLEKTFAAGKTYKLSEVLNAANNADSAIRKVGFV